MIGLFWQYFFGEWVDCALVLRFFGLFFLFFLSWCPLSDYADLARMLVFEVNVKPVVDSALDDQVFHEQTGLANQVVDNYILVHDI